MPSLLNKKKSSESYPFTVLDVPAHSPIDERADTIPVTKLELFAPNISNAIPIPKIIANSGLYLAGNPASPTTAVIPRTIDDKNRMFCSIINRTFYLKLVM